tara:strand:+ start:283 stop:456 length:174 start_codon:yes stop_codon:yes gene_type:complete
MKSYKKQMKQFEKDKKTFENKLDKIRAEKIVRSSMPKIVRDIVDGKYSQYKTKKETK